MPPTSRRPSSRHPGRRPGAARRGRAATPAAAEAVTTYGSPRITRRMAVLLLVLLVLAISYASSLKAFLQQRDALATTRAQISESSAAIERLEKQKLRFDDPEYVEQQARSRFGWVMPGEIGFTVLGPDGKPVGKGPELPDAPPAASPGPQWHETLWGSVEVAGGVPDKTTPTPSDEVVTPKIQDEGQ
ncbi:septum formation initiator family protein [Mumia sp. zg.B17]|uniref:FtsB family cell division protein n=1 Tax=Mumia sp. zg.B17 TaxID=2855446 RepID=UPI001C6ED6CE|nr:septum formation initiator family protein [Mumia sp. zg.B17]MBW9207939.1 septum formation initiator family protein [Mumia sp. zg.B17]